MQLGDQTEMDHIAELQSSERRSVFDRNKMLHVDFKHLIYWIEHAFHAVLAYQVQFYEREELWGGDIQMVYREVFKRVCPLLRDAWLAHTQGDAAAFAAAARGLSKIWEGYCGSFAVLLTDFEGTEGA